MATNLKTPAKPTKNGAVSMVRVVVRVRPFLAHEISSKNGNPVPFVSAQFDSPDEVSVHLKDQETSRHECYKLDAFFGQEDNIVAKIFEKEVSPLIPGVFRGCNTTVFAYGATGSGKTYTMQGTDEQPGLMPLAISTVLSFCQSTGCIAEISYYEVYLDRCYDLLDLKANEIAVLDDKEGRIHLRGLSQVPVNSMSEFHEVFARGIQRRKVAHTGLNDVSSRSHAVLVIAVATPSDNESEAAIIGKLNLIDLAGNEDNRRSGNEGIRMLESTKINQSLLALSNVIYALNNNKAWVPYRESKLTRILQDSLGETNHALMVACLSPGDYQESVHTVSLAACSRQISNVIPSAQKEATPKARIDMEAKLRAWLESKGKTYATQRMRAVGSPSFTRTPGYASSMKGTAVNHGSVKMKAANNATAVVKEMFTSAPQRKLFDSEASSVFAKDVSTMSESLHKYKGIKHCFNSTSEALLALEDGCLKRNSSSVNLYDSHHCSQEVQKTDTKESINEFPGGRTRIQLASCLPDELLEEDEKMTSDAAHTVLQSPPNRPITKSCQSPLRNPLSPVHTNICRIPIEDISSKESVLSLLLESQNPTTPFVVTREKFRDFDTPLDKFSARTSNLKSFLVEEYIDFLNTATREELVELKGIGVKRAEYVIDLRETSPLKSLTDLEKIGLSSKQVQHMFSKAAKGIFE